MVPTCPPRENLKNSPSKKIIFKKKNNWGTENRGIILSLYEFSRWVTDCCAIKARNRWHCASELEQLLVSLEGWPTGADNCNGCILQRMPEVTKWLDWELQTISADRQQQLQANWDRAWLLAPDSCTNHCILRTLR